ncbi:MAG: primosomal protein N' [Cytophagales bacterium]
MNSLFDNSEPIALFAEVILPLPLNGTFTYRVPMSQEQEADIGKRVVVQFGSKKVYTGIVKSLHNQPPQKYNAKPIIEFLDTVPIITKEQFKLFETISSYYMCSEGEVLSIALPSALKISSETNIFLTQNLEDIAIELSEPEIEIVNILKITESITFNDLTKSLPNRKHHKTLRSLVEKNLISLQEEVKQKYKAKIISKVKLNDLYNSTTELHKLLESIQNKEAQANLLLHYINASKSNQEVGMLKSELAKVSSSALNTLLKNKIFIEYKEEQFRILTTPDHQIQGLPTLSDLQQKAYEKIRDLHQIHDQVLLYGITGSGKTEIYINLIDKYLNNESTVIYLLPEIALTTQIVERLKKCFGNKLAVYHSKFSENERVEVYNGVLEGRFQLIVGARSALFLPYQNLGLIIVDEEHETSYKQYDPAPRYHGRDMALVLAKLHQAKALLGSATPSIETMWLAQNGKYGLVELTERYGTAKLPYVHIIKPEKTENKSLIPISNELLHALKQRLEKKEQSILFLNRRGFSPSIICETCGWTPTCPSCNVNLTYHQYKNSLNCHYCGYAQKIASNCFACSSVQLKTIGFGTEKIEDELKLILPEAKIKRMDLETTRSKYAFQELIAEFAKEKIDILVGTQMVSKGLDFDNVTLVGVIDLDQMLYFPDFRAQERTFQLVTQVSGRAGRKLKEGEVIIQTHSPKNPFNNYLITQNYYDFYKKEIIDREVFNYPPFSRIIKILIKDKNKDLSLKAAIFLNNELIQKIGKQRVKGPIAPSIDKIRDLYLQEIIIKFEREKVDVSKIKNLIKLAIEETLSVYKSTSIVIDVDCI